MEAEKITIAVICGTIRDKRRSLAPAKYVAECGRQQAGVEVVFVDPKDFHLPSDGNDPENKDPRYTHITATADAFFIITPEYNHSFPGSLKRLLDSELKNYIHKPVALAGVSDGNWGGVRAVESLVPTLRELGLVVTFGSVYFPRVQDIFDETGAMKSEFAERYATNMQKAYAELLWMARALKTARQQTVPAAA